MSKRLLFFVLIIAAAQTGFAQCAGPVSGTASPMPTSHGTYYPGTTVTFCFTENGFSQDSENWFHGLTLNVGPGWDLSTLTVISEPPAVSGSGSWNYYPNGITSSVTGEHYGPGFYFGTNVGAVNGSFAADGDNPGENYGDDCTPGPCSWTFCFSIKILNTTPVGTNLSLTVTPSSDAQSGSWADGVGACDDDTLIRTSPISDTVSVGLPFYQAQLTPGSVTCFDSCNGTVTAQGLYGVPPYKYKWNTGATTAIISNLCPGSYSCTLTDAGDSVASASAVVTKPTAIATTDSLVNPICNGNCNGAIITTTTGGVQPYSYLWSTNPQQSASVAYGLCAGTTTLTLTDANNCSLVYSYTLNNPPLLTLQLVSRTEVLCYGGNTGVIAVSAAGGNAGAYLFNWSNGETGGTADTLRAGNYFVTVTDVLGCTTDSSYRITQPANPIVIAPPVIVSPICDSLTTGSITVSASGGTGSLIYLWTLPDGASDNGTTLNNLSPGLYKFTVTDANNCEAHDSIQLTPAPSLFIDSIPFVGPTCYGGNNGQAAVYIHGGTQNYSYRWSVAPQDTFFRIDNLSAGTITVTVTDAKQCMASASVTINQPAALILSVVNAHGGTCAGDATGSITVSATGGIAGYSYVWNNQVAGPTDTGLSVSSVIVTVTDANNCTMAQTFTITQPQVLVVTPVVQNAVCFQSATGLIDAKTTGGTPPYSYLWSDSDRKEITEQIPVGYYTVTVTDANGCVAMGGDSVTQPPLLVDSAYATPVKCIGQENGTISITASGGAPPYYFSATQDNVNFYTATNGVIVNLDTGTYEVIIHDNNGCSNVDWVYVANATADNFFVSADSTTCFGPNYNDGAALATYSSFQNAPYQFNIDFGVEQDTGFFQNLSAGLHQIIATNKNGCMDTLPVFVPQPLPIVVTITPDSLELPLGQQGKVQVGYLNATNPTFGWTGDIIGLSCVDCSNPVVSPFVNSDYTVAVSMVSYNSTCYGYGTLHVTIQAPPGVFVPNAFSPNGDGVNDIFTVYGEGIASVELSVFNRWGELVFETQNSLSGWDGTYKGQMQPVGVYAYTAVVTLLDNTKITRTGSVALMR